MTPTRYITGFISENRTSCCVPAPIIYAPNLLFCVITDINIMLQCNLYSIVQGCSCINFIMIEQSTYNCFIYCCCCCCNTTTCTTTTNINNCNNCNLSLTSGRRLYTVSGKKEATLFSTTTLAFFGRFL